MGSEAEPKSYWDALEQESQRGKTREKNSKPGSLEMCVHLRGQGGMS